MIPQLNILQARWNTLRDQLSGRKPLDAMQTFEKLLASGLVPGNLPLPDWVISSIGLDGLCSLVIAYATASCPDCVHGRRDCSACDATGRDERGSVCRCCLGTEREPCRSCHGDSLSNYGRSPDDLRPLVLSYRLCIAACKATTLVPEDERRLPEMTVHACLCRIVKLNKLAGVLENAAVEVTGQQARGMIPLDRLERVKHRFRTIFPRLESAIRETLDRAAELCANSVRNQDVLFYHWLSHSRKFEGTSLQRDFAARLALQSTP